MSNFSSPGGWRDRLKKTRDKQNIRDDMAEVRAERARASSAKAEEDARAAAAHAAEVAATRCACPVCDSGTVTVELAERVYRALQKLPSDSRPDPDIMLSIARIAQGQAAHGHTPRVALGLAHPRAVEQPPKGKKHSKNSKLIDDGALIELED